MVNTTVDVQCPECGQMVGATYRIDGYKHLINCMHVPNVGTEQLRMIYAKEPGEHAARVMFMLDTWAERFAPLMARGE